MALHAIPQEFRDDKPEVAHPEIFQHIDDKKRGGDPYAKIEDGDKNREEEKIPVDAACPGKAVNGEGVASPVREWLADADVGDF